MSKTIINTKDFLKMSSKQIRELAKSGKSFAVAPKAEFDHNYSYCLFTEKLMKGIKEIPLTPIQKSLLNYFIENSNRVVTYEELQANIWNEKSMTRFTLRNQIKSIRDKSYKELILNVSNNGYILN